MPRQCAKKTPQRPVRQARQARAQSTVSAIIGAAARILADEGWGAVNTNAIARRAGVSVGSVYEYFPDKQAIIAVIIDQHLDDADKSLARAADHLSGPVSNEQIIALLVAGFVGLHSEHPRLHRALSGDVPLSPAQRQRIAGLRMRIIRLVADDLRGQTGRPQIKATLLVDAADALTHRWLVDETGLPVPADVMSGELASMLRGYVAA